jgi:predicted O-linked N-acetylglucosamine transferase (SPINDLY family)
MDKPRHLARHRLADVFLDTRLCNAHTTAVDAVWAGLPVITCPGETFASRVAASVLSAAGLEDLICNDLRSYKELAIRFATDPRFNATQRERVAAARHSPLFDTARYTRDLEAAYEVMWKNYLSGRNCRGYV